MIYHAIAVFLMAGGLATLNPQYFVAAAIYELAGAVDRVFTPRRLKKNDT